MKKILILLLIIGLASCRPIYVVVKHDCNHENEVQPSNITWPQEWSGATGKLESPNIKTLELNPNNIIWNVPDSLVFRIQQ